VPEFRYEIISSDGVPIHGVEESDSPEALRHALESRGVHVVSVTPTSLPHALADSAPVPLRLTQLRIGETLRIAFLTQIPVAQAVRAAAREPIWNPAATLLSWCQVLSLILLMIAGLHSWVIDSIQFPLVVIGIIALLLLGPVWITSRWLADRPRKILMRIAQQIDSGQTEIPTVIGRMSNELQKVADSELTDEQKSLVTAEILTSAAGTGLARHRLFLSLLGPLVMLFSTAAIMYVFYVVVIPDFQEMFEGFGLSVPAITLLVLEFSQMLHTLGYAGALLLLTALAAVFVSLYAAVYKGVGNEALRSVPLIGTGLQWANLAALSRRLAMLVRNDVAPAAALKTAVAASPSSDIRQSGDELATQLKNGDTLGVSTSLDGIPVSMLAGLTASDAQRRRPAVASTLDGLARMFESAVFSSGIIIASIGQMILLLCVTAFVGLTIIALFLPLIQLMNDLS